MRVKLYQLVEPQALSLRSRFRTGDLLGVLANDIEHLQDFYLKTMFPAIISIIIYAVLIACAGIFSVSFAALLSVFVGLILFLSPFLSILYIKTKKSS